MAMIKEENGCRPRVSECDSGWTKGFLSWYWNLELLYCNCSDGLANRLTRLQPGGPLRGPRFLMQKMHTLWSINSQEN